jgi:hypothetical protein
VKVTNSQKFVTFILSIILIGQVLFMDIREKNLTKYWLSRSHLTTIRQLLFLDNVVKKREEAIKYLKMIIRKNTDINTYQGILRDLDKWLEK